MTIRFANVNNFHRTSAANTHLNIRLNRMLLLSTSHLFPNYFFLLLAERCRPEIIREPRTNRVANLKDDDKD